MSARKVLKTIAFTASAQEQHVALKTKSILKWLKLGHEVRVQIQGKADRQKAIESIYKHIENEVKNGAEVKQKTIKPDAIKFNLRPTAGAANLSVDKPTTMDEEDIDQITAGKDVLSEEFAMELDKSLEQDKVKKKR